MKATIVRKEEELRILSRNIDRPSDSNCKKAENELEILLEEEEKYWRLRLRDDWLK